MRPAPEPAESKKLEDSRRVTFLGDALYDRYVTDVRRRPLAREAAGRLIELERQLGDSAAARSRAEGYLKQYPTGPHASLPREPPKSSTPAPTIRCCSRAASSPKRPGRPEDLPGS